MHTLCSDPFCLDEAQPASATRINGSNPLSLQVPESFRFNFRRCSLHVSNLESNTSQQYRKCSRYVQILSPIHRSVHRGWMHGDSSSRGPSSPPCTPRLIRSICIYIATQSVPMTFACQCRDASRCLQHQASLAEDGIDVFNIKLHLPRMTPTPTAHEEDTELRYQASLAGGCTSQKPQAITSTQLHATQLCRPAVNQPGPAKVLSVIVFTMICIHPSATTKK